MWVVVAHFIPNFTTVATVMRVYVLSDFPLSLSPVLLDFMAVVQ